MTRAVSYCVALAVSDLRLAKKILWASVLPEIVWLISYTFFLFQDVSLPFLNVGTGGAAAALAFGFSIFFCLISFAALKAGVRATLGYVAITTLLFTLGNFWRSEQFLMPSSTLAVTWAVVTALVITRQKMKIHILWNSWLPWSVGSFYVIGVGLGIWSGNFQGLVSIISILLIALLLLVLLGIGGKPSQLSRVGVLSLFLSSVIASSVGPNASFVLLFLAACAVAANVLRKTYRSARSASVFELLMLPGVLVLGIASAAPTFDIRSVFL